MTPEQHLVLLALVAMAFVYILSQEKPMTKLPKSKIHVCPECDRESRPWPSRAPSAICGVCEERLAKKSDDD